MVHLEKGDSLSSSIPSLRTLDQLTNRENRMAGLKSFWEFVEKTLRDVSSQESIEKSTSTMVAAFQLAGTLKKEGSNVEALQPLIKKITPFLETLDTPLGKIAEKIVPFLPIFTGLLKFFLDNTKENLTYPETIKLICLVSYTHSLKKSLESLEEKKRNNITTTLSTLLRSQISGLEQLTFDESQAKRALHHFNQSDLAKECNRILRGQLIEGGMEAKEVDFLLMKVSGSTYRYIYRAMCETLKKIEDPNQLTLLSPPHHSWYELNEHYDAIDKYLERKIDSLPEENINRLDSENNITLEEIYVPIEVSLLEERSSAKLRVMPLHEWAKKNLLDPGKQNKVMFVQGGAGQGKSSFCSVFSHWVRQHLHPVWTPVLIRLKD